MVILAFSEYEQLLFYFQVYIHECVYLYIHISLSQRFGPSECLCLHSARPQDREDDWDAHVKWFPTPVGVGIAISRLPLLLLLKPHVPVMTAADYLGTHLTFCMQFHTDLHTVMGLTVLTLVARNWLGGGSGGVAGVRHRKEEAGVICCKGLLFLPPLLMFHLFGRLQRAPTFFPSLALFISRDGHLVCWSIGPASIGGGVGHPLGVVFKLKQLFPCCFQRIFKTLFTPLRNQRLCWLWLPDKIP